MQQKKDKQAIIATLMPFIIAFVEPKELKMDLCAVADGDMTHAALWQKWGTVLGNLRDSTNRDPLHAPPITTTDD